MDNEFLFEDITKKIIKCFYKIYDELGSGFLARHEAQLINDLKATCIRAGSLVTFGDKLEFKRRVFHQ